MHVRSISRRAALAWVAVCLGAGSAALLNGHWEVVRLCAFCLVVLFIAWLMVTE